MSVVSTVVCGALAGMIAKIILPGPNDPRGFIPTILVGIAGAFLFTFLGQQFGLYSGGRTAGLIGATIGAIIVLLLYAIITKKRG